MREFTVSVMAMTMLVLPHILTANEPKGGGDLEKLQGEWKAVYANMGGQEAPAEVLKQLTSSFKKDEFSLGPVLKATVVLDETKSPRHIDFKAKEATFRGIYRIEKDTLTIVWYKGKPDDPRPKEFDKQDKHPGLAYLEFRKAAQ